MFNWIIICLLVSYFLSTSGNVCVVDGKDDVRHVACFSLWTITCKYVFIHLSVVAVLCSWMILTLTSKKWAKTRPTSSRCSLRSDIFTINRSAHNVVQSVSQTVTISFHVFRNSRVSDWIFPTMQQICWSTDRRTDIPTSFPVSPTALKR